MRFLGRAVTNGVGLFRTAWGSSGYVRTLASESNLELASRLLGKFKNSQKVLEQKYFVDRSDMSTEFSFRDKTGLDAVARILSFQDPCTAVVEQGQELHISYNDNVGYRFQKTTFTKPLHIDFMSNRLDILIQETALNYSQEGGARYILSNALKHATAYEPHLRKLQKLVLDDDPQLVDTGHQMQEEVVGNLEDFISMIEKYKFPAHHQATGVGVSVGGIEPYLNSIVHTGGVDSPLVSTEVDNALLEKYFTILDLITDNLQELENNKLAHYVLQHMLPMLNDATKVNYFFTTLRDATEKIKILDNDNAFHCEVNIVEKFGTDIDYIGISKLCCFLCHVILESKKIHYAEDAGDAAISNAYAGLHGLFYYYDPKHLLQDEEVARKLVEYMTQIVSSSTRGAVFKDKGYNENSTDPISFFLNASDQEIADIFDDTAFKPPTLFQNGDYCFGRCSEMEDNIRGFHTVDADISLSKYNGIFLELGVTLAGNLAPGLGDL